MKKSFVNDRSILALLDANFTYVNTEFAKLYGIPGVEGDRMQRVLLTADDARGGLLSMAGVLSLTSHPDRHSAVERAPTFCVNCWAQLRQTSDSWKM